MRAAASLVLGIALTLAGAAMAKDKPVPKTDEPRKATGCEFIGEGYIKAPGTDTCIKVSGSVRAEGSYFIDR